MTTKAEKIKQTIKETKERRKNLNPIVYQLKIQNLSKAKEEKLNRVFLEAKWLYNWIIANIDRVNTSTKEIKEVDVKVGDKFEKREIKYLGSQLKQAVQDRVKNSLKALKALKENGHKVGRLKFKKSISSINLKQYKVSFDIDFERNKVRIQGLGWFRVLGLHQIPQDCEIANAQLVKKPSGYYLYLTCYVKKEYFERDKIGDAVGIDFGVANKLTLSNGLTVDFEIEESKRLKRLQKELARKQKGSKNWIKTKKKIQREYEKLTNKRKDIHNKILALFRHYETVVFEIIDSSKEFLDYIAPKGDTTFGFWMQTLADLEFLDLELQGLSDEYKIDPINKTVALKGDDEFIRLRVAHLEKVKGKTTLYTEFVDKFGDTNAYAFHNLYPYKGKFYPRIVRTLINAFKLDHNSIILDPFNGSGTTTHEASLMGIKSVGIDVSPMGITVSKLKNDLLFIDERKLDFTQEELQEILQAIENRKWEHHDPLIHKLMLAIYFDTADAFVRTSRYNRKGKASLFIEKFNYVRDCYRKIMEIKEKYSLEFKPAEIIEEDILNLCCISEMKERFDACITSPPYYFSIDYVGKDKIAYDYLGIDMDKIKSKYLGMKNSKSKNYGDLPIKVAMYYDDLKESIRNIYYALKPGGKLAIIVGDSTVNGKKIPTTMMTKKFCEEVGFKFEKLIFNPLLGTRNRAIRGESVIICHKEK
jgi:DNA modification methylase